MKFSSSITKAFPAAVAVILLGACSNTGTTTTMSASNAEGLITAGKSAVQAATLSDADVMQLSEKSCAELDGKSKIAGPKSKYALFGPGSSRTCPRPSRA